METPLFWILWAVGLLVSSLVGSWIVKKWRDKGLYILGVFLAIYVVGANILVPRLVTFQLGWKFVLVTGSIIWPFTAQLSDMINEIYGKKSAYLAAALSYGANLMFVLFTFMAFNVTPLDAASDTYFKSYFGVAWRVLIASMCSYTLANLVDINIFSRIKKWAMLHHGEVTGKTSVGKIFVFSSLRSILSDGANMVIDNIVFYGIAFYGTMPFPALLGLIGSSMLAKVILSQIDLPFYWLFRVMTRGVQRDM